MASARTTPPGDLSHLQTLLSATIAMDPRVFRESGLRPEHDVLALPHRYAARVRPAAPRAGRHVLHDGRQPR